MQFSYLIGGGTPTIKKYKMAAGHAAGIVVLVPAADATGLTTSTTTGMIDAVGLTLDAILSAGAPVAYSTTQGAVEHLQSVIINADAVFKSLMVGSAVNAVVEQRTVGTASSNGLTAVGTTGETDPSTPDMDEGTVWYNSGSNGGASRKITSTTTTLTVTVIVPFAANRVGDKFMTIDYTPGTIGVTQSTNLLNTRVDIAATGAEMYCVDLDLNGPSNSYLELILRDHIFSGSSLA
jgi:hypothetical protein